MAQLQAEKPQEEHQEPIRYGDLFSVDGQLAEKAVAPKDASLMQMAENVMLGQTQKGGIASVLQSAAAHNERAGIVGHDDAGAVSEDQGVTITETDVPGDVLGLGGSRIVTESLGGQVIGQYNKQEPAALLTERGRTGGGAITIGEALEASGITAGDKPVEWSDAAAIQAAEVRATGRTNIVPGGVAAAAQSAATHNARVTRDEDKTKLASVVADATARLPADKAATRRDAEGVTGAEMRNDPYLTTHPAGVAASVAAAARLNKMK